MVPSLVGWCDWDKCILWDTGLSVEPGQGGLICFNQKGGKCFGVHHKQNFNMFICAQIKKNILIILHHSALHLALFFPCLSHACH